MKLKSDIYFGELKLIDFLKENQKKEEIDLSKYGLIYDFSRISFGKFFSNKYYEAPYNFCITFEGNLIAHLGFDLSPDLVFIKQVQGVKGKQDLLKPIKWERALVCYAIDWSLENGFSKLGLISVENHPWANIVAHLDKKQGYMIYDVTAKRLRYKEKRFEKEPNGDYIMKLI